jgi:hypothetical protein
MIARGCVQRFRARTFCSRCCGGILPRSSAPPFANLQKVRRKPSSAIDSFSAISPGAVANPAHVQQLELQIEAAPRRPGKLPQLRQFVPARACPRLGRAKAKATHVSHLNMAIGAIEHLADETVSVEERERRKRRLVQGPREFRDMRERTTKADKK